MSRYIDADKAIEIWKDQDYIKLSSQETNARIMLDAVPSADVVEVVRCEDCRYSKPNIGGSDTLVICERLIEPMKWFIDDYCSYGERKDDE